MSDRDIYSASVDESATVFCTLDNHEIAAPAKNTKCPVVLWTATLMSCVYYCLRMSRLDRPYGLLLMIVWTGY
jgi:hypothetical protein